MKFSIGLTLDAVSITHAVTNAKSAIVYELERRINDYIKTRNYGEGVIEYAIILYIVNPPVGYEHLFKDFKPRFTEYRLGINKFTGEKQEISRYFNYSVKITRDQYVKFVTGTDQESEQLLAREILASLSNVDKLPKKVKDFDKEKFKSDMDQFSRGLNLL